MDQEARPNPDFALPGFAGLVEIVMEQGQISREEAIEVLTQRWVDRGAGGIQPDRQEDNGAGAALGDPPHPPAEVPDPIPPNPAPPGGNNTAPAASTAITFDSAARVASMLSSRPADYALKRLESQKHVPLWYFTREGLREAARTVRRSDENETLAITQAAEGNVTVRAANSLTASKNAKLDHQLSYADFMFAKNHFLTAIESAKWGVEAVDAFNWFFHKLDTHSLREEGDQGERALLHYTARVRLDWHDKLALGKAYNIGTINEELLTKIARELDARDVKVGLEQVGIFISTYT